ncbi:hypothetical protein QAD02_014965 [Eretmocerus hayati]|uniref:Uncharacterized protein n=1 Tax=Eretmocerus hayati TaxID=131215 RepID=A0ACC2P701_9HYME|nr:hypothetical protein QAD02_014965 [Eretmocerus hayati]
MKWKRGIELAARIERYAQNSIRACNSRSHVLDCLVSEWGPWTPCDSECGHGAQTRSRFVERSPENGGKHCPQLVQQRGCQGTKCHRRNPKSALKEVALLLPHELSDVRHMNDSNDIRVNLRLQYQEDPEHDASRE